MNAAEVDELDYIQFLIATQKVLGTTGAAWIQAGAPHDAYTRLWNIPSHGRKMDLKGYGWVKMFQTVIPDGREEPAG